jgi:MtN3 and saliva related transmembrane protein
VTRVVVNREKDLHEVWHSTRRELGLRGPVLASFLNGQPALMVPHSNKFSQSFLPNPERQLRELFALQNQHPSFMDLTTLIGLVAAFCTTVSYYPQLKKCWETGSAGDLSLKMFLTLAAGVALWIVYGFLKSDVVIIIANVLSLALLLGILYFKLRERLASA